MGGKREKRKGRKKNPYAVCPSHFSLPLPVVVARESGVQRIWDEGKKEEEEEGGEGEGLFFHFFLFIPLSRSS